jgi:hypothetical protein
MAEKTSTTMVVRFGLGDGFVRLRSGLGRVGASKEGGWGHQLECVG